MPPISILMVSSGFYPKIGGTERQAELQARMLQKMGFDVRVVALRFRKDLPLEEDLDGLRVTRIDYPHWKFAAMPLILMKLSWLMVCERNRFDVVHVHMVGYLAFAASLTASFLGKPIVLKFAVHPTGQDGSFGDFPEFVRRFPPLKRFLIWGVRRADRFIAISGMIRQMAIEAGLAPERILSIPNAVHTDRFRPAMPGEREKARDALNIRAGFAVLFSGRLIARKGISDLLIAWKSVCDKHNDATLYLLGTGRDQGQMIALSESLGLSESVRFCGVVENVADYMHAADLFVLPSHFEGMSNALLEAMACGLPVVATAVSGVVDLVRDGKNGVLVGPGRPDRLAEAVLRMLDDPAAVSRLGKAARETVEKEYSMESVARRYAELYRQLLAAHDGIGNFHA